MKHGITVALAIAALAAASAAQAQDNESGFYAGGGIGQFDVGIDDFDDVDDTIDARVYHGIHFRAADVQGAGIGRNVACWLDRHFFQPVE